MQHDVSAYYVNGVSKSMKFCILSEIGVKIGDIKVKMGVFGF